MREPSGKIVVEKEKDLSGVRESPVWRKIVLGVEKDFLSKRKTSLEKDRSKAGERPLWRKKKPGL